MLPVMVGEVGRHLCSFGQILLVHLWLASLPPMCRHQVAFELYHKINIYAPMYIIIMYVVQNITILASMNLK